MSEIVVTITGVRATGFHGVHPEEQVLGQTFVVDAALTVRIDTPLDDRLDGTVSYSEVARGIHALIAGEPVKLIETLAERIGEHCLSYDRVQAATVTVHKPSAPIGIEFADVAVTMNFAKKPQPARTRKVVWSLGSNLGDRLANLEAALTALDAHPGISVERVSAVYQTEPVESDPQPDFFNVVAIGATELQPAELIAAGLDIEAELGRVRTAWHGPRPLDIDVVDIEGVVSDDSAYQIPHPRARYRRFVLEPWLSLDRSARLGGVKVVDLLDELADKQGCVQLECNLNWGSF